MFNNNYIKSVFISSLIIFLIGFVFHFAYNLLGNFLLVGFITPVNESVNEHLKLAIFPIFIWWFIFYLLKYNKHKLDKDKFFFCCLISIIISIFIILGGYYFLRFGLNIESSIINIILLFIAILIGQIIGVLVYITSKKYNYYFSYIIIAILIIIFVIFTFIPPKLPMFEDPRNNTYGIYKYTR